MRFKTCSLFLFLALLFHPALFSAPDELSTLIQKGELLIEQKSYPAGIAVLEAILEKDPKNAHVLNVLLSAYDAYTRQLVAQNHFSQAETYLEKMDEVAKKLEAAPEPNENRATKSHVQSRMNREMASAKGFLLSSNLKAGNDLIKLNQGREQYNQAVDYFKKRQYDIAEDLLKESTVLDPSNPFAFELLGEIANMNHRLDEAEQYYKKAFSLSPDPRFREKYEKLLREKKIDTSQQQYEDEHFIIRYRRNENLEGSKIRDFLREAYRTVSQDFAYYPRYKIPVILYDRAEYEKLIGSVPHWSGAVYDGKIRLPVYQGTITEQELRKFIHHELTHAFILDLSQLKCPVWLNEGLAQYEENKIQPVNLQPLADAARHRTLMSIEELTYKEVSKVNSQNEALLFYLESYSFTSYILERSRFYNMKQFLIELGKGKPFMEAFEKAFGRSFHDFSAEWKRQLEAQFR